MISLLHFTFTFFVPVIFNRDDDIDRDSRSQRNQERRQTAFDPDYPLADQPNHQISNSR